MKLRTLLLPLSLLGCLPSLGYAQTSSLYRQAMPGPQQPYPTLEQGSWTYIPVQAPKQVRVNDIVTIRVDEMSRMMSEGEVNRRKTGQFDSVLQDWVKLVGLDALKPSPQSDGDPRVRAQENAVYRALGELETRESVTFNIAAKVVDLRPNGNLVLEAHRTIRINNEAWECSLIGECRKEDIGPDNTLLSRNIVDLHLDKRERGHVRDSYRRGWALRWWDQFRAF